MDLWELDSEEEARLETLERTRREADKLQKIQVILVTIVFFLSLYSQRPIHRASRVKMGFNNQR